MGKGYSRASEITGNEHWNVPDTFTYCKNSTSPMLKKVCLNST